MQCISCLIHNTITKLTLLFLNIVYYSYIAILFLQQYRAIYIINIDNNNNNNCILQHPTTDDLH